jgi:hypothetical protein
MVGETRLKSSFIYLANAVNDLRANWAALAIVLSPLVVIAAICVLPDALNLQHLVAGGFAPGVHNVSWLRVQEPYPATAVKPPFPRWVLILFRVLLAVLGVTVQLFVMCTIRRVQAGVQHPRILNEALEIYREALHQIPSFLWIRILQFVAITIGLAVLVVPGLLLIVWLYFAEFALVFDGYRSFGALLQSRDLLRKRFFRAACRIGVFLAVWSGYNSWAAVTFFVAGAFSGWLGMYTGSFLTCFFVTELLVAPVGFATTAFFVAAGARLYRDLAEMLEEDGMPARPLPLPATTG